MQTFKQYMSEAKIKIDYSKLSDFKDTELLIFTDFDFYIPITPKLQKIFFDARKRVTGYHIMDSYGLEGLKRLENSKSKSVSCVSVFPSYKLALEGVTGTGGILAKLTGSIMSHFKFDSYTSPDKYGRRWINLVGVEDHVQNSSKKINKIKNDITQLKENMASKYWNIIRKDSTVGKFILKIRENSEGWDNLYSFIKNFEKIEILNTKKRNEYEKILRKILADAVGEYIEKLYGIVKKNFDVLSKIFTGGLYRKNNVSKDYDELLLNKIKVQIVYVLSYDDQPIDEWYLEDIEEWRDDWGHIDFKYKFVTEKEYNKIKKSTGKRDFE